MSRLAQTGLPMNKFSVQHRMHPDIAQVTNRLIHGGEITNSSTIGQKEDDKAIVDLVRATNVEKFRTGRQVVFLNVDGDSDLVSTHQAFGKSRFNEFYLTTGVNLAVHFLEANPKRTSLISPHTVLKSAYSYRKRHRWSYKTSLAPLIPYYDHCRRTWPRI